MENIKKEQTNPNPKIKSNAPNPTDNSIEKTKKIKKYSPIKEIITFLFIILSLVFYKISLNGCEGTQSSCLVNLDPWFFYNLAIFLATSSLIVDLYITLLLYKKISKYHLIYIIPLYSYIIFFYDNGGDLNKHGSYNRQVFFLFLVVFMIIILIYLFLRYLRRNHFFILISIFLGVVLSIVYFRYKLTEGCDKWIYGLNGMKIENDPNKDKCYIVHPDKCWINMLDGIFDISRIIHEDCSIFRKGEREELLKYLDKRFKDTYNFGYPITTRYTWLNESHYDRFFKNVMKDMIDLDKDTYTPETEPEIKIKFDKETKLANIEINIKKNESLIKERNEIYNKLPKNLLPKYKNILFVYIDALSRPHFIRKMKYTKEILNKYLTKQDTSRSVYQMMKYQSFLFFTPPNINPMFYGESMLNSNGTHIIRAFKEKGFITGQANDICSRELYDLEDDYTKDMDFEAFDYENIALFCDPNFHNLENPFTPYLGPYSVKRRCLYGDDTFQHVLNYGYKFWETYKDQRKFLRVAFQDAHEGTGEAVRYLDIKLAEFLNKLINGGLLEDTAVFFVSDHGNNMVGLYNAFLVQDFVMEKTLGSFFLLLPNKEDEDEVKNLLKNQQTMVTPYDIHETMLYMMNYPKGQKYYSRYGQSVYTNIDSRIRDCNTYSYDLNKTWCRCITYS